MLNIKHLILSFISLVSGLLVWQYFLLSNDSLIPTPIAVSSALIDMINSGELYIHTIASMKRLLAGWILGSLAGCLLGGIIGISKYGFSLALPWLFLFLPVPKIALLPVFIILFGIGETSRILTIGFGVFLPTTFFLAMSVRSVPKSFIEMGNCFKVSKKIIIQEIIIPSSLPGILICFRLTTAIALILLISAEMLGAQEGLGCFILGAGSMAQLDKLFAGVVIISLLGLIILVAWHLIAQRLVHWQKSKTLF